MYFTKPMNFFQSGIITILVVPWCQAQWQYNSKEDRCDTYAYGAQFLCHRPPGLGTEFRRPLGVAVLSPVGKRQACFPPALLSITASQASAAYQPLMCTLAQNRLITSSSTHRSSLHSQEPHTGLLKSLQSHYQKSPIKPPSLCN